MEYNKIPLELKGYNQWVVWKFEDIGKEKPTKRLYNANNGYPASHNKSHTWCGFETAKTAFERSKEFDGIGFVLSEDDPYTFIDLDDTKGNSDALQKQIKIYNEFESFAEKSPSGKGLHIIVKGSVPCGRKREYVEVYSTLRFMTVTADVFRDVPIANYNDKVNDLWAQMSPVSESQNIPICESDAINTDDKILEIAQNALNGAKFNALLDGNWQNYYNSQSEADFAFVDIIAFYSRNIEQVKRIFKNSPLGARNKQTTIKGVDYLSHMVNRSFDNMLPPVNIEGLKMQFEALIAKKETKQIKEIKITKEEKTEINIYTPPPGLIGDIAQFIYAKAPRPVPEIALAGAIGLMSGITGRAYNISGTGLNQYTLLLAPTGTGKEAISSGVDKLLDCIIKTVPAAADFLGPGEIASSQAIIKYMSRGSVSFLSVVGEFGIYMQQMASTNAPPHLIGLKRFLLDAYNKSGQGKVLRPMIYSDKDKNTNSVLSPAFSLLGESTPEKFYEGLHEGLISEGLLPRFTLIEYMGDRPPYNANHIKAKPSSDLIERLSSLCSHALMLNSQNKTINVNLDKNAKVIFDNFDKHCDLQINSTDKEVRRHLWNRGHIKALKLAAIVAVGQNPYNPTIDANTCNWAINIVKNDARNFINRFDAGEIGIDNDETKQLCKVTSAINDFFMQPWSEVSKYAKGMSVLHSEKIIPYSFIQRKLASIAVFRKDRLGSSAAIKRAISTLIERGDLQEVSKAVLSNKFNLTARSFMVSNLNMLDEKG